MYRFCYRFDILRIFFCRFLEVFPLNPKSNSNASNQCKECKFGWTAQPLNVKIKTDKGGKKPVLNHQIKLGECTAFESRKVAHVLHEPSRNKQEGKWEKGQASACLEFIQFVIAIASYSPDSSDSCKTLMKSPFLFYIVNCVIFSYSIKWRQCWQISLDSLRLNASLARAGPTRTHTQNEHTHTQTITPFFVFFLQAQSSRSHTRHTSIETLPLWGSQGF